MNVRRCISMMVLGAILVAQAPPVHAGRMLCPMKMPVRTLPCARCDAPRTGDPNGSFRAASCCRMAPAPAAEATPLVLSSRPTPVSDPLPPVSPSLGVAVSGPGGGPAGIWTPSSGPPGFERLARTTVLRN